MRIENDKPRKVHLISSWFVKNSQNNKLVNHVIQVSLLSIFFQLSICFCFIWLKRKSLQNAEAVFRFLLFTNFVHLSLQDIPLYPFFTAWPSIPLYTSISQSHAASIVHYSCVGQLCKTNIALDLFSFMFFSTQCQSWLVLRSQLWQFCSRVMSLHFWVFF